MKYQSIRYLPSMFATCMLFMTLYTLCIALWWLLPGLPGHAMLETLFPGFKLLDLPNALYGMFLSGIYGWVVAIVFVFFYNLWAKLAQGLFRLAE
jgi:hypothetical protein